MLRNFLVIDEGRHKNVGRGFPTELVLGEAFYLRWIDAQPEADELLKQYPAELMTMWPVSDRVGNYRNDDEDLLRPAPPAIDPQTGELL